MNPIGFDPISFQAARAYGLPAKPVRPVPQASQPQQAGAVEQARRIEPGQLEAGRTIEQARADQARGGEARLWRADGGSKANPGVARLIAGKVPGTIDFSGGEPVPGKSLSIYRSPTERNIAATGVSAGRVLDVTG